MQYNLGYANITLYNSILITYKNKLLLILIIIKNLLYVLMIYKIKINI